MGSSASVLQWACKHCALINPTERNVCYSCGRARSTERRVQRTAAAATCADGASRLISCGTQTDLSKQRQDEEEEIEDKPPTPPERISSRFASLTAPEVVRRPPTSQLKKSASICCSGRDQRVSWHGALPTPPRWKCPNCNFFNSNSAELCAVCFSQRETAATLVSHTPLPRDPSRSALSWSCEHGKPEACVLCALPKLGNGCSKTEYHCSETPSVECQQTATSPKKHDVWFFTRPLLSHFVSPKHLPKLNSKWTCDKCHFFNIPSTKQCIICESSKNSGVSSERNLFSYLFGPSKKGDLLNGKRLKGLSSRLKNGGKSDQVPQPPIDETLIIEEEVSAEEAWVCRRCTYENAASLNCCEICESPRRLNIPATLPRNSFSLGFLADIKSSFNAIIAPASSSNGNSVAKRSKSFSEASRSFLGHSSCSSHPTTSNSKMWTCAQCTFAHNPYWQAVCCNCEAPLQGDDNLLNNNHDNNNSLTTPLSNGDVLLRPRLANEWTCVKCTLINAASDRFCSACGGSKLQSTRANPSASTLRLGDSWVCDQCTFRNQREAAKCDMCGNGGGPATGSTWQNHTLRGGGSAGLVPRPWECSSCTFQNTPTAAVCEMCQASRSLLSLRPEPQPCQGETELMDELRAVEENDARLRWQSIVDYCKEVPPP